LPKLSESTTAPPGPIIRTAQLWAITGLSNTTDWREEKPGRFPRCVRLNEDWFEDGASARAQTRVHRIGKASSKLHPPEPQKPPRSATSLLRRISEREGKWLARNSERPVLAAVDRLRRRGCALTVFELTVLARNDGPLTKRIALAANGAPKTDRNASVMTAVR
jgi:hypothetical protein